MKAIATIAAVATLVGVAWSATSALADDQDQTGPHFAAAGEFAPDGPPATTDDLAKVRDLLGSRADGVHVGKSEVRSGTVVHDGFSTRISAFEADRGQVCFVGHVYGMHRFTGCAPTFTDGGVIPAYDTETGEAPAVHGLVASDVTALRVITRDGEPHDVEFGGGGFWWIGEPGDEVVELQTTRAGKSHSLTSIFERSTIPGID